MHFSCRRVDASFLDTAPMRFVNVVELETSPAKAFAILADAASWPRWFRAIHKTVWTSEKPYGVGSTRTISMLPVSVDEHFFRWEPARRFSFYATGTTAPLAHALAEDYLLQEIATGKTRFTYTVAMEPRFLVKAGGPLSRMYFEWTFKSACDGLKKYVLEV